MRHVSVSAAAVLLVGRAVAQVPHALVPEDEEATAPAPKAYIIEYSSASLRKRQEEINNTPGIEVVRTFESDIFHGVSVETEEFNIDTLNELPDVVNVWLNEEIPLAPIDIHSYSDDASAYNYTTHVTTGVSKLHEEGIFGKGVRIGVVDTGIYYPHDGLGGGLGEGFKVAGGYDFVGDGDWPFEPAAPDEDPIDTRGHGTHVAGIIAGKTDFWQGVAPEAELYAYKVFTVNPSTSTEILIASFIRAYEDGCDIITASIGGANGYSNNPWAEVASRLVDLGVVVTISAGNSGANGPFYGSSGSSGKNVLAIASVETEDFPASPFEANFTSADGGSEVTTVGYLPSTFYFPPTVAGWPIVPLNLNPAIADDACTPFPSGTPSLKGAVALVRRGGCTFAIKQQNLEALGAEYILIYNSETSPLTVPSTDRVTSLIGAITDAAGKAIIRTIAEGGSVTADFSPNPEEVVGVDYNVGGRPSAFTSWAALYDLQSKPDVAAPGGNIFSTWSDGGYSTISGTSMACPYVAGVSALWISVHGGRSVHGPGFARQLHQRIISSGVSVPWYDGTLTDFGYPAAVAQVGNGLVNAYKVVKYDTRMRFSDPLALNDTRYFERYHDVTVSNEGDETVEYTWSVEHGAGIEALGTFAGVRRLKRFAELRPVTLEASVSLPRPFKLKPGESKTVSVNFDNPDKLGWNAAGLPVYGGKVLLAGSNGERLSVPFYGVGADLRRELNPLSEKGYPLLVSGPDDTPVTEKSTFSFDLSLGEQDFPKIYSKLLWGSREVRWDVYEAGWRERDWTYPPVIGEGRYVGTATSWSGAGSSLVFDPAVDDPESTFSFPVRNTVRNVADPTRYYWFGKLGNGTQIANGKYQIRFAALKPFGNPAAADNWEVYKTPEIEVTGQY